MAHYSRSYRWSVPDFPRKLKADSACATPSLAGVSTLCYSFQYDEGMHLLPNKLAFNVSFFSALSGIELSSIFRQNFTRASRSTTGKL